MEDKRLEATARLLDVMTTLRRECPWDREQTFDSLRSNTIEETYELADAITDHNMEGIKEELRNRKMKKYRGYLLVLLIAFCIQGCSKQQDVEDHSFVLAMGFERLNEKKVLVRYSYADFDKAQSDSGTKIPSRSVTFLATSLKDANKKWKQYKSQQLNFGHLKVVLFANGKKDEKIIKELVNEPQIAKSVYVLKTDRNLSDIFKKEDELSISFGEYLSKKLEIKDSKNLTLGRIYR